MQVKAFRGLRPRSDLASRIPSPPYDVVDSDEARRLAADDPHSFLHVLKPEIDLEPGVPASDARVYRAGAERFRSMIADGWLVRDDEPAFYVYRLTSGDHVQTGLVGLASVDDYLEGRIRRHELTRPDKEDDRARHIEALSAHAGPVLMTYRRVPELSALVKGQVARDPDVDFPAPDGVRHALWVVRDAAARTAIEGLLDKVPALYIADGHHRAAAAARVADRSGAGPGDPEEAPARWFLAALFPSHQLRILDYNRVVRDLNGLDRDAFVDRIRRSGFAVESGHRDRRPPRRGTYGMYLDGSWSLLTAVGDPPAEPARALDVAVLAERVLEPVLGIGDVRTDRRIDFVGGGRGMDELERRVDSGKWAVAFAVYPTSIDDLLAVADAGAIMPPKSTWFEPKLRSGMVVHAFGAD